MNCGIILISNKIKQYVKNHDWKMFPVDANVLMQNKLAQKSANGHVKISYI